MLIRSTQLLPLAGLTLVLLSSCEKSKDSAKVDDSEWSDSKPLSSDEISELETADPPSKEEVASGLYYVAYIHQNAAAQTENEELRLEKLLKAEDCLNKLMKEQPEWQPDMVLERLNRVKMDLAKTRREG